jgi:hypothetical protein
MVGWVVGFSHDPRYVGESFKKKKEKSFTSNQVKPTYQGIHTVGLYLNALILNPNLLRSTSYPENRTRRPKLEGHTFCLARVLHTRYIVGTATNAAVPDTHHTTTTVNDLKSRQGVFGWEC